MTNASSKKKPTAEGERRYEPDGYYESRARDRPCQRRGVTENEKKARK